MITSQRTNYYIDNPRLPDWAPTVPEHPGFTALGTFLGALAGSAVGLLVGVIADAAFVGGRGIDNNTDMTGAQAFAVVGTTAVLGAVIALVILQVLPRVFKPTYFSNCEHKGAYLRLMELSAEERQLALPAYEALAGFDSPSYSTHSDMEMDLFWRAQSVWSDTLDEINTARRQNRYADTMRHEIAVQDAKDNLDSLRAGNQTERELSS